MSVYGSSAEGSSKYKGSKESSVNKSCDEIFDYSCDPCSSAGDNFEAKGFCTNCGDYLCGSCFRSHSKGKATKHHKLLNKDNMPRKIVQSCDPCKIAGEEVEAIGYCENCDEYLCNSCFRSHSRSKATKHHNLMDKDNMPKESYRAIASSIAKIDIHKESTRHQKSKKECSYVREINVKVAGDAKNCYIVAMTLVSNHELVLADYDNESLKLVDIARNVIKGTLNLDSGPHGLTTVSKDEVAVSLYAKYVIQIVKISDTLSVQRNIRLTGLCLDIEYLNGKLYASFWKPVCFQIIRPPGAVYKTIKPDAELLKHCTLPDYIAVSPNESLIYVSDRITNKVMSIDMYGNMISMYQRELDMPTSIVINTFGPVYLCNSRKHVIYKMTPNLSEVTAILGPGEGLEFPHAMCFNFAEQYLYISSGSIGAVEKNNIKVFKYNC